VFKFRYNIIKKREERKGECALLNVGEYTKSA